MERESRLGTTRAAARNAFRLCLRQDAPIEGPASKEGAHVDGDL